jgi:hypothetical protein
MPLVCGFVLIEVEIVKVARTQEVQQDESYPR